jgi:hypothetical protein
MIEQQLHANIDDFANTENAKTHNADRTIHALNDLLVTHTFHLAENDRIAQFLRQIFDHAQHHLFQLLTHQLAFENIIIAQTQTRFELFDILNPDVVDQQLTIIRNQIILRDINHDPMQPNKKLNIATETTNNTINTNKNILHHILHFHPIVNIARRIIWFLIIVSC